MKRIVLLIGTLLIFSIGYSQCETGYDKHFSDSLNISLQTVYPSSPAIELASNDSTACFRYGFRNYSNEDMIFEIVIDLLDKVSLYEMDRHGKRMYVISDCDTITDEFGILILVYKVEVGISF